MDTRSAKRRRRPARVIRGLVLLGVAAVILRTWCVQGLFVAFEVTGGSMAPMLVGPHREVCCGDCGYRFDCGAEAGPTPSRGVCPNCDYAGNDLAGLPLLAGDRVLVHRSIYQVRPPRRWELAAFRLPSNPSQVCVKRVVGLPGESVEIRDGDVYVDGRIARKGLGRARAMAVPVYEADRPPTRAPAPPPRWQSEPAGRWGSSGGRFVHAAAGGAGSIDWLTYHHGFRLPGSAGQVREGPITNRFGYNQVRPLHPANVHPVRDVLLSFRLARLAGPGRLVVRATDGTERFQVWIDPAAGSYGVSQNDRPVASGDDLPKALEGAELETSLVDRRLLLAVDGRLLVSYPYEAPDRPGEPTSRPLAIGSQGLGVEIRQVRVSRDVYYTRPLGVLGRWGVAEPVVLGKAEYFVLGDNSAVSSDSRTWPEGPTVPGSLLLGKPIVVYYPARLAKLGRWEFQVPDPAEIRYIR